MSLPVRTASRPSFHAAPRTRGGPVVAWKRRWPSLALATAIAAGCAVPAGSAQSPSPGAPPPSGACEITSLHPSSGQGLRVPSYDGSRYLVNKDDAKGVAQVYVGRTGSAGMTCITCEERPGGPKPARMKMQARWHPSGRWIVLAVERDTYSPPPVLGLNRRYVEGQLQNGLWTNIYAVSPDGKEWHRMSDFTGAKGTPDGFTGVAFTSDGRTAVWSQIVDGNILAYWPFGRWELTMATFEEDHGVPRFVNPRNITPPGMNWNEPGNFHPDDQSLVFTGSTAKDAQGMDIYVLNVRTGRLENLTDSPTVWDEHALFSPGGTKIVFMSAWPYRDDPKASKILSIKTEFMLMDRDGRHLAQLTHFRQPGFPEYAKGNDAIAATGFWGPGGRTLNLLRLKFPKYEEWELEFAGPCGGS